MIFRFKIDAVDWLRRGIDTNSSIISVEVNPAMLSLDQRGLIAKHLLDASDACDVVYDPERVHEVVPVGGQPGADLIEVKDATIDSLLMALREL
jgi:hypothetical protein